jgi:hypothetical protein
LGVLIEGARLSSAAVADLVARLHGAGHFELAQRIGMALDRDLPTLRLYPGDRALILEVIEEPGRLRQLKEMLTRLPDEP